MEASTSAQSPNPQNFQQDNSGQEFLKDMAQSARPALDVPPPSSIDAADSGPFSEGFVMPDPPAGPAAPLFTDPALQPEEPAGPTPPLPKKKATAQLQMFMSLRNILQSRLLCMIAKSSTPEKYRLTDEDLDLLTEAWMPYAEQYGGAIPPVVMLLAVELMVMAPKIIAAVQEGRVNAKNEKLAASPEVATVMQRAAAAGTEPERTRWKIDGNGYYTYDRYKNYIAVADRTEKASLTDIQQLVETNGEKLIGKVFNITDLAAAGYKADQE